MANIKSKDLLFSLLKNSEESLSRAELLALSPMPVADRTARHWLKEWLDAGLIIQTGQFKSSRYQYQKPASSLAFLQDFDADLRHSLLSQIRDLWTHSSTALEGNTLTLGDTHFLLEQGLTISGKPLKDHQEVVGHAKAIDLLYELQIQSLCKQQLFSLHKAVQSEIVNDIYKPVGEWKLEMNGTYAITAEGKRCFIEYAAPQDIDTLMSQWLQTFKRETAAIKNTTTPETLIQLYAKLHMGFVHIHPFWDGNGRLARLMSNLPLVKAGHPPLMIPQHRRREYIELLARYQMDAGQLTAQTGAWPKHASLTAFEHFCADCYKDTQALIEETRAIQKGRS